MAGLQPYDALVVNSGSVHVVELLGVQFAGLEVGLREVGIGLQIRLEFAGGGGVVVALHE